MAPSSKPLRKGSSLYRSKYGGIAIDIEGLERLGADMDRLASGDLSKAIRNSLEGPGGEAIASEQRRLAPKDRGTLVGGIGVHKAGAGADVLVGYNPNDALPRGQWAESGVRPHTIQPTQRKSWTKLGIEGKTVLAFDGQFYANVYHPGYRGKKVASRSIKNAEWELLADVVDQINYILDGAA